MAHISLQGLCVICGLMITPVGKPLFISASREPPCFSSLKPCAWINPSSLKWLQVREKLTNPPCGNNSTECRHLYKDAQARQDPQKTGPGEKDNTELKSMACSCRKLQFDPIPTTGSSQPPRTPAPGDLAPSSGCHGYLHSQVHTHTHAYRHTHNFKKFNYKTQDN